MKKTICIILLIIPNLLFSKPGYDILNNHSLHVGKIRTYNQNEILSFKKMFNSIYIIDQECRTKSYDYFRENVRRADSITFYKYKKFFERTGYFSFNKDIMSKWFPDITNFLLKHYAMQLHFSDRSAFELMSLIEKSIPRESCNEEDLMDYFVTYMFRKTQFKEYFFLGNHFHVALIPNMESGPFCQYYKYAFYKYVEYCKNKDNSFVFVLFSDVVVDKNKNFNWNNFTIKDKTTLFPDNFISEWVKYYKYLPELIIKDSNLYKFQSGKYNVLLCTHPNIRENPQYNF